MKIHVGTYRFTKMKEAEAEARQTHTSTTHNNVSGTIEWSKKILELGLNGVEFDVFLAPKQKQDADNA